MKLLAFVPAKGVSERFPGKNLATFLGKPLIEHTLDFLNSFSAIEIVTVVVTDSREIAQKYADYKNTKVFFITAPAGRALLDVREAYFRGSWGLMKHDQVGMFLPTAPLRRDADLYIGTTAITEKGYDAAITVSETDFPPTLAIDGYGKDNLDLHFPVDYFNNNTRTQDQPKKFRPNGQMYLASALHFQNNGSFFHGKVRGIEVPRNLMVDIDFAEDMRIAELIHGDKNVKAE